jgi:hypothetical protein
MDQNINQEDYLNEKGSGNEARIRRVTYEYTLPEIIAATKKKKTTERASGQNKAGEESTGSQNARPKNQVTQRKSVKASDSTRNNKGKSEGVDAAEIQTYAQEMLKQRGELVIVGSVLRQPCGQRGRARTMPQTGQQMSRHIWTHTCRHKPERPRPLLYG